jgi:hypothetical protein
MSQISINDKKEENERLKEYITMEQEKLDEARKFLAEDKDKFNQMMADSQKSAKATADKVKDLGVEKKKMIKEIEVLVS